MKNSKFRNVQGRTFLNDGIPAASEDPQRIKTAMDGGGSQQKQVCSCKLVAHECTRMYIRGRACG